MDDIEKKDQLSWGERVKEVSVQRPKNTEVENFETEFLKYLRSAKSLLESFLSEKISLDTRISEPLFSQLQGLFNRRIFQYSDLLDEEVIHSLPIIPLLSSEKEMLNLFGSEANNLRDFSEHLMFFLQNMIAYRAETSIRKQAIFDNFVEIFFTEKDEKNCQQTSWTKVVKDIQRGTLEDMERIFAPDSPDSSEDEIERQLRLQCGEGELFKVKPPSVASRKVDEEILSAQDVEEDGDQSEKNDLEKMKTSTLLRALPKNINELLADIEVEKRTGDLAMELEFLNQHFTFQSQSTESEHPFGKVLRRLIEVENIPGHNHAAKAKKILNSPLQSRIFTKSLVHEPSELLLQRYGDLQDLHELNILQFTLRQLWGLIQLSPAASHINEGNAIKKLETYAELHLQKKIGSGGMGNIYLAEDKKNNRKVAVKMLKVEGYHELQGSSGESKEVKTKRFERESLNLRALSEKVKEQETFGGCVPETYRIVSQKGVVSALLMEYVEGMDFQEILKEKQKFAPVEALDHTIAIASVLRVAHVQENCVVHRDIKPSNIKIKDDTGEVVVLDWGNSHSKNDPRLTQDGGVLGTVAYMSPEQISGLVDPIVDVYSLGATLYEMLSGRAPYPGNHAIQIIMKISHLPTQPNPILPLNESDVDLLFFRHKNFHYIQDKDPTFFTRFLTRLNQIVEKCMRKKYACDDCMKKNRSLEESERLLSLERMKCCSECQKHRPELRYQSIQEVLDDLLELRSSLDALLN